MCVAASVLGCRWVGGCIVVIYVWACVDDVNIICCMLLLICIIVHMCSVKCYVCNVLFSTLSLSHRVGTVMISIIIIIIVIIAMFQVKQPVLCSNCHVFCGACIDVWLQRSHQCPTCRVPIDHTNPVKRIRGTLNRCKKIRWLAMLSGGRGKKMKQCTNT